MECPYCSNEKSKVTDKRVSPDGIRRRRECLKCGKRFTTYEKISQEEIYVIKKDNSRQRFDKEKIMRGLERAFEKRPVSHEELIKIAKEVEEQIRRKGKKEIKSEKIGEVILKKIKRIDEVAYVRFASVYRDFKDIKDFKKELKEL